MADLHKVDVHGFYRETHTLSSSARRTLARGERSQYSSGDGSHGGCTGSLRRCCAPEPRGARYRQGTDSAGHHGPRQNGPAVPPRPQAGGTARRFAWGARKGGRGLHGLCPMYITSAKGRKHSLRAPPCRSCTCLAAGFVCGSIMTLFMLKCFSLHPITASKPIKISGACTDPGNNKLA